MAEDGQGPGLPEVKKITDVGEAVECLDSLAVSSEGSDDDTKNLNAADTPPSSKADEGLAIVPFGTPPPTEECPVCFIPLPRHLPGIRYKSCCGKEMCSACFRESERVLNVKNAKRAEKKLKPLSLLCPFCRASMAKSDEELVRRYEKRAKKGDRFAIYLLADYHRIGRYGLAKDLSKSVELLRRAADLGDVAVIGKLGAMYAFGFEGVSLDETRGREYLERAAKKGNTLALANLGALEERKGRAELALTYFRTAAAAGDDYMYAIDRLKKKFRAGKLSKDDLLKSMWAHHTTRMRT